jgi:myosin heavy subunit
MLQYEKVIGARDEKIHELSLTIEQLRESQVQRKKDYEDLTAQCEQYQNHSHEAEGLLEQERTNASRQSENIVRLEAQVTEHQHHLEEKEAELEDALRQLHVLRTSYHELEETSAETMRELVAKHANVLEAATMKAETERKELEAQLHNAEGSVQQERYDHEKTRSDVQHLQALIPPLEIRIQELDEFCKEQEEELEEFRTARKMMAMHLLPARPASRTYKEIAQPQNTREPRTHRRRKSAINTQEDMPKARSNAQELSDKAMENVENASFPSSADSNSSQGGGPTPKRAKPRPAFKVPTMQTPYTQRPDMISKPVSHSHKLSSSKRALGPVSPNRRHTAAGFTLPDGEGEDPASEFGSAKKPRGSPQPLEQTDFDIDDEFTTDTPLTPGFMSGTGRMPAEDDETMTEL